MVIKRHIAYLFPVHTLDRAMHDVGIGGTTAFALLEQRQLQGDVIRILAGELRVVRVAWPVAWAMAIDAGGNALLRVAANGDISTVATFPSRPERAIDAVPTSVAVGRDGAYYVGELTGVPFSAGAARVYRVVPGEPPTILASGFKTILDLDFGPDGSLYVLEHASGPVFFNGPGRVIRVASDGARTTVLDGLNRPTSLVVDWDGTIYVTNNGISAGAGEVLKLRP